MNTSPSAVFLFLMVFHFLEDSRRILRDRNGVSGVIMVGERSVSYTVSAQVCQKVLIPPHDVTHD